MGKTVSMFVGSFVVALSLAACGGGGARRANVQVGSMPPGGTFEGVWFSQQYGEMHMRQNGTQVIGEYTKDERRGQIQGAALGDVLRFEWSERREMVPGRPTTTRGHGYFKFAVGDDGRNSLTGEWGNGPDEVGGGPWTAYQLRNRRPHLSTDPAVSDEQSQPASEGQDSDSSGSTSSSDDDI